MVLGWLKEHSQNTGSPLADDIILSWTSSVDKFVKVTIDIFYLCSKNSTTNNYDDDDDDDDDDNNNE